MAKHDPTTPKGEPVPVDAAMASITDDMRALFWEAVERDATASYESRLAIEARIERLISLLDAADGDAEVEDHPLADCDLELDHDDESCSWPEGGRGSMPMLARTGLHATTDDDEACSWPEGGRGAEGLRGCPSEGRDDDAEPSLGAPELDANRSQGKWSRGSNAELRDECEEENEHGGDVQDERHDAEPDEPDLGWPENVRQVPDSHGGALDHENCVTLPVTAEMRARYRNRRRVATQWNDRGEGHAIARGMLAKLHEGRPA